MNIVMIRTNGVDPDPRVEKEVNSLLLDHSVTILAWDRLSCENSMSQLNFKTGSARIIRYGILSEWGGGMKKNFIPFFKFYFNVKKWLLDNFNQYDCVHCCDLPTAIMADSVIKKGKKFVFDIFDYFSDTAHAPAFLLSIFRNIENKYISKADVTIICSEQRLKQIQPAKYKKLVVIHNSPDMDLVDLRLSSNFVCQSESFKPKVVYVGNLIQERYIKTIINIAMNNLDIEFHIGGIGVLANDVEEASKSLSNLFYYGKMAYSDVLKLEQKCDIMLALYDPNIKNNQYAAPNKFYEALMLGKPLVMINGTGMSDFVVSNMIGCVVDSNELSITNGLIKLIDNQTNWESVRVSMNNLYLEKYSWAIMEERLRKMYSELM